MNITGFRNNSNHRFGFTLIELLVVIAILILLSMVYCVNFSHGTGEKIGQVVKLSQEGIIRKTWEAQLIRGGMNGGSGSFGTVPFDFTIESDEMVKKVIVVIATAVVAIILFVIKKGTGIMSYMNRCCRI